MTEIMIDLPTIGDEAAPEAAPQDAALPEEAAAALKNRPRSGRPRNSSKVAVPKGKATAVKAPAKPKVAAGKAAVSSRKRTAGKDVKVTGAATGTTLTKAQQAKVDKLVKRLHEVEALEDKRSSFMWEAAEITHDLLAPSDADGVPMKQKELAKLIGVHPTNVSIWAKTFKIYGDPANRVKPKGVEASFNDHVERARMLNDDGTPANPELYRAIEKQVEAEEGGVSFAVAKRQVRTGPTPAQLDMEGARDRVSQFSTKLNELAGPTPSSQDIFVALAAFQDLTDAVAAIIDRAAAAGGGFTDAHKQLMDNFEARTSEMADKVRN